MSEFQHTDDGNLLVQSGSTEGTTADTATSTACNDPACGSAPVNSVHAPTATDPAASSDAPAPTATATAASEGAEGVTHKLTVDGEGVKMDQMGPVIINTDGSVRRIANWNQMSPQEQANAWRLISKRNERRRAELLAAAEEARVQAELHGIPEAAEEEEEEPPRRALPPSV